MGLWSLLHVLFLAQHQTRGISIKAVFRSYLSELSIRATKKTVSIRTVSSPVWVLVATGQCGWVPAGHSGHSGQLDERWEHRCRRAAGDSQCAAAVW